MLANPGPPGKWLLKQTHGGYLCSALTLLAGQQEGMQTKKFAPQFGISLRNLACFTIRQKVKVVNGGNGSYLQWQW